LHDPNAGPQEQLMPSLSLLVASSRWPISDTCCFVRLLAGLEPVEKGSREVVRVALLGPDGPPGTFTRCKNTTIPWRR
jgi:hypothetical protein